MEKPNSVARAETAIWFTLALAAVVAVIDRQAQTINTEYFFAYLLQIVACALIPYKIGQGRNWARYIYVLLGAFSAAIVVAGEVPGMPKLDIIVYWVTLPLECWIIWNLFRKESAPWFIPAR